jgi:hypothetical protein
MKKLYIFLNLFTTSFLMAQSPLLVEHFDYTAGTDIATQGWNIHSGGTTNPILTSSSGLSFAGYSASGVGNAALVNNTGIDVNKPISSNVTTGSVYASFLVNVTANTPAGYFFHLGFYANQTTPVFTSLSTNFRARTHVAPGTDPVTQFKLGLSFNANDPQGLTSDLTIGQTYLVVVKYTFVDGDLNDTVSLFVYSTSDSIPASEPATPTLGPFIGSAADAPMIQAVILRQYSVDQRITVDGIVVRTNWDLVSPLSIDSFADNNSLKIYPNPVNNDFVTIESSLGGDKEVTLFDMNGRMLLQKTMTSDELDLSAVNKGIYLLQTKIGSYTSTTKLVLN